MTIGEIIKKKRTERGLAQAELAHIIGVTQPAIGKLESGKSTPSSETLKKLADFFLCTADELLGRRVS